MRLFGIDILLHPSMVVMVALLMASLSLGVLPAWHPDWSTPVVLFTAAVATLSLFASILLHELSHALVAKAKGLPVPRITLFIFGGVASIEREPPSAGTEFLIAIAGPLTSLAIAAGCLVGGVSLLLVAGADAVSLRDARPAATVLLWLAQVNTVLALFNLVPGFPLDGGRVARSILWAITGDLRKATRIATWGGQLVASGLILCGVFMLLGVRVPIFGAGGVGGIWLILIGWFLRQAALGAWHEAVVNEALRSIPVSEVMRRRFDVVPLGTPLLQIADEWLLQSDLRAFPVVDGDRLAGQVTLDQVRAVPREDWAKTKVDAVMTPIADLPTIAFDAGAKEAMRELRHSVDEIPVVRDGRIEGVFRRDDLARWLALHQDAQP